MKNILIVALCMQAHGFVAYRMPRVADITRLTYPSFVVAPPAL